MEINVFENDLLGLDPFADQLERFVDVERHFVPGSLVVSLTSEFGTGKTTFLNMWKNKLESEAEGRQLADGTQNLEGTEKQWTVIQLNAWESDYYGDALFAILSGLIESLNLNEIESSKIKEAAKDLGNFALGLLNGVAAKATGMNVTKAVEYAENRKKERIGESGFDAFSLFEKRKKALGTVKATIERHVDTNCEKVLCLVDELDRCRPDFAISYLETIKHIFDVQGMVFVLAVDRKQLENSARTAFGKDLDFEEYLRKFVHREVRLPQISRGGYEKLVDTYTQDFLEAAQRPGSMERLRYIDSNVIKAFLIGQYPRPRQLQEIFRLMAHVFSSETQVHGADWTKIAGTFAMCVFKTLDRKMYEDLAFGRLVPNELYDYLSEIVSGATLDFWFSVFATGRGIVFPEGSRIVDVMLDLGFFEEEERQLKASDLQQMNNAWGVWRHENEESRFLKISRQIDHVVQWDA